MQTVKPRATPVKTLFGVFWYVHGDGIETACWGLLEAIAWWHFQMLERQTAA